jgi:histidyl-tRNA synthetase
LEVITIPNNFENFQINKYDIKDGRYDDKLHLFTEEHAMQKCIVKIENIEDETITVSGLTSIHGSLILEIKPVMGKLSQENSTKSTSEHKDFRNLNSTEISKGAPVIIDLNQSSAKSEKLKSINYTKSVLDSLEDISIQNKLDFYTSVDDITAAINQALSLSPV